jgi:hypothetical protein
MEHIEYNVKGNRLILRNGNSISFDYPIKEKNILIIDSLIIVVLDIPTNVRYNENVYAINKTGKIVWRIKFKREDLFYQKDDCCFSSITINKGGQLVLFNWCDTAFIVDPQTGTILDTYNTK